MSEWVSVKDRMPEDGARVLVADARQGRVGVGTYARRMSGWWVDDWIYSGARPTHWMPLPDLPEVDDERNM